MAIAGGVYFNPWASVSPICEMGERFKTVVIKYRAGNHWRLAKRKLKPQGDITAHLSEGLQLKIVIPPIAGEDEQELDHSSSASGNIKWGKQVGNFFKSKRSIVQPSNRTPGHLAQGNEDLRSHKHLCA